MTGFAPPSLRDDPGFAGVTLLTVDQVGQLLGVSKRSVWRLAACDEIPRPIHITGRLVRWQKSALEQFIEEKRRAAR